MNCSANVTKSPNAIRIGYSQQPPLCMLQCRNATQHIAGRICSFFIYALQLRVKFDYIPVAYPDWLKGTPNFFFKFLDSEKAFQSLIHNVSDFEPLLMVTSISRERLAEANLPLIYSRILMSEHTILSGPVMGYDDTILDMFRIFTKQVWLAMFVSVLTSSLVASIFALKRDNRDTFRKVAKITIDMLARLFNQGTELPRHSIQAGTWLLCSFLLSMFFSCQLLATLTISPTPLRIDTLEDILQYPRLKVVVHKNTEFWNELQTSQDPVMKKLLEMVQKTDSATDYLQDISDDKGQNARADYTGILNGSTILIGNNVRINVHIESQNYKDCSEKTRYLHKSPNVYSEVKLVPVGRRFPKALSEAFIRQSLLTLENGMDREIRHINCLSSKSWNQLEAARSKSGPLNLWSYRLPLFVWVLGLVLSFLLFLTEVLAHRLRPPQSKRELRRPKN